MFLKQKKNPQTSNLGTFFFIKHNCNSNYNNFAGMVKAKILKYLPVFLLVTKS